MKDKIYNYILLLVFILAVFLGLYRFYPYILSDVPLGYDPGLYRNMFLDYFHNLPYVDFSNLALRSRQAYPPFLGLFTNILLLIGYDVDFLITFGLAFFSFISSIYVYLILKKYSHIVAIHGMIIFFISVVQYESFFMNYYKQIIGVIFILVSLYLLEKKKYLLSIPIIISLFTIHRPSGLFFLLIVIFYVIFNHLNILKNYISNIFSYLKQTHTLKNKEKGSSKYIIEYKSIILTITFSGFIALLMYIPLFDELIWGLIKPLTSTFLVSGNSGTFFTLEEFLGYNLPIILLSIYGLYIKIKKRDFDLITFGFIVGLLWTVFRLFFYSRFLIFFDLFIILVAAYGLGELYKKKLVYTIVFGLFFIPQSLIYFEYLHSNGHPFIPKSEFAFFGKLDTILESDAMLITSHRNYSPRLYGYTTKPIIAPGLLGYDLWEKSDWNRWWSSNGALKCDMLRDYQSYNKPLYLWIGIDQDTEDLSGGTCLETIYDDGTSKLLKVVWEGDDPESKIIY